MNDEILKDLNRVIEKYKDKVFCTGELNYVDMAKSCKLEIERLNNKIHDISETLNETYNDRTELRNENNRLNNIINELKKDLIEYFKKEYPDRKLEDYNLEYCTYDYALVILGKLQELKGSDK